MSYPLLLDEMLPADVADQLGKRKHDVQAVVTNSDLLSLPDDRILAEAATDGRALVTVNVKDFMLLDAQYKMAGRQHAGLVLVSTKAFTQDGSFLGAVIESLDRLLADPVGIGPDRVVFLRH
jgi:Domain of unknown function (DUF5615)